MRRYPNTLLAIGLLIAACNDPGPSPDGTLVVSTSTGGGDPDQDGYLLAIDVTDSLDLDPTGTVEVGIAPGRHALRLLGVAEHCLVTTATSLEVHVPSRGTVAVAFEMNCPAISARITTTTTGLDLDPDGYRLEVDGTHHGMLPPNGAAPRRLEPGSRTIALTGLAPNCTIDGAAARIVIITELQVAQIEFAIVCTARSGVIGVAVEASGSDVEGAYAAMVDGVLYGSVGPGGPAYLSGVPAGDHVISLVAPNNCLVETDPRPVVLTAGGLIRDTVDVTFSVSCNPRFGTIRITVITSGLIPALDYNLYVSICTPSFDNYGEPVLNCALKTTAALKPNGTWDGLLEPGRYRLQLTSVPGSCQVGGRGPFRFFSLEAGDTIDEHFRVTCSM